MRSHLSDKLSMTARFSLQVCIHREGNCRTPAIAIYRLHLSVTPRSLHPQLAGFWLCKSPFPKKSLERTYCTEGTVDTDNRDICSTRSMPLSRINLMVIGATPVKCCKPYSESGEDTTFMTRVSGRICWCHCNKLEHGSSAHTR